MDERHHVFFLLALIAGLFNAVTAITEVKTAADGECDISPASRYDCGFAGVTSEECLKRSCCFNETGSDGHPICFYGNAGECTIAEDSRLDCGTPVTNEEECLAKGCCYQVPTHNHHAPWCYYTKQSPTSEFRTKSNDDNQLWLRVHRTNFAFTVQSCKSVKVMLTMGEWREQAGRYEFLIGDEDNKKSSVYKYNADNEREGGEEAETDGILDCETMRTFYIGWDDETLTLRHGSKEDEPILSFLDDLFFVPTALSLSSDNSDAVFDFSENIGSSTIVRLKQEQQADYQLFWQELEPTQTSVVFKVWACRNAQILLATNKDKINENSYEIVIGRNDSNGDTSSIIRHDGQDELHIIQTSRILEEACNDEFIGKWFWIEWLDGIIAVGEGSHPGRNPFIQRIYTENVWPPRFVAVATTPAGDVSKDYDEWTFPKQPGDRYYINLPFTETESIVNILAHGSSFTFDVMSPGDVHVFLATDIGHYRYGFSIGLDNDETQLLKYDWPNVESTLAARSTPGILDAAEPRRFWVSWHDGVMQLGKGPTVGQDIVVSGWDHTEKSFITSIGLKNGRGSSEGYSEWTFDKYQVRKMSMSIPSNAGYSKAWYSVTEATYMNFKVVACEGVEIALSKYMKLTNVATYVVTIGDEGNTKTIIRNAESGEVVGSADGPVLSCNSLDWYWLSWADDTIRVGKGDTPGWDLILSASVSDLDVNAVGVASTDSQRKNIVWEFDEPEGRMYTFFTSGVSDDRRAQLLLSYQILIVQVKSCSDAVMYLHSDPDEPNQEYYSIAIGENGNSQTSISKDGIRQVSKSTKDILNCDSFNYFWISWINYDIIIGHGTTIGEHIIADWKDENPSYYPTTLTFTTSSTTDGQWKVHRDFAHAVQLVTPDQYNYNYLWANVEFQNAFIFQVQSCSDAHIALNSFESTPGLHDVVEIVIGGSKNQFTLIRSERLGQNEKSVQTSDILDCDEARYFWVSWFQGNIEVGRGSRIGAETILSWVDPEPHPVAMVAVSSGFGSVAKWLLAETRTGDSFLVRSLMENQGSTGFLQVPNGVEFSFAVHSCGAASIQLYQDYGKTEAYEIVIGAEGNSITYIRRGSETSWSGDQQVSTPDILSCIGERAFTLAWGVGGITLFDMWGQLIIFWVDNSYLPVYSLSVAGKGQFEYWAFSRRAGETVRLSTYSGHALTGIEAKEGGVMDISHEKYLNYWMALTSHQFLIFEVQSCAEAHILLTSFIGVISSHSYEIRIGEDENTQTAIYSQDGQSLCHSADGGILNCEEYVPMWISWSDGSIKVGKGRIPGSSMFLSCNVEDYNFRALSFASERGNDGEWLFEEVLGERYEFWTAYDTKENTTWIIPNWDFLSFEVESSQEIVIYLFDASGSSYEVRLGILDGSKQVSKVTKQGELVTQVDTLNLLTTGQLNKFWIAWTHEEEISIGMGMSPLEGVAIFSHVSIDIKIFELSFASVKTNAWWSVPRNQVGRFDARMLPATVPPMALSTFSFTTRTQSWFIFQVRSLDEVRFDLTTRLHEEAASYTLVLGMEENTVVALLPNGQDTPISQDAYLASATVKDILSPTVSRSFWLSWTDNTLSFGRGGFHGEAEYFSYTEDGFSSVTRVHGYYTGEQTRAWFRLIETEGNVYALTLPPDHSYDRYWMEVKDESLVFRVRGAMDAHVLVSAKVGAPTIKHSHEIVLGSSKNNYVAIRNGPLTEDMASVELRGVLSETEFRTFWITWKDGVIAVGSGSEFNHMLLTWTDLDPIGNQKFVSFSAWDTYPVHFEVFRDEATWLQIRASQSKIRYEDNIVTMQDQNYVVFDVQACTDALIALQHIPGTTDTQTYEIAIGIDGAKGVAMRTETGGNNVIESATGSELLNCEEYKTFWAHWNSEERGFYFGKGSSVNRNTLFNYVPDNYFMPNAVSFNTGQSDGEEPNEGRFIVQSTGSTEYSPGGSGLSGGQIFGIIIGTLLGCALLAGVIAMVMKPELRHRAQGMASDVVVKFTGSSNSAGGGIDPSDISSSA